jgi:type II secretory pathway component PulF
MFARNMALMMRAGISISEAIDIMLDDAQKPVLKKVLMHIKLQLERGSQLSEALAAFPRHFSRIFISLLKSGEASGNMENALMQIAAQLKKEDDLRKKIRSAMAYPAILIAASFGVMLLLSVVVLPKVSKIFSQSHVQLPFITRILLGFSDFITHQWPAAIALTALSIAALYMVKKSESGRLLINAIARKTPVVNTLIQKIVLARFTSVLYSLLKAGVPIIKALEITSDAVGNALYRRVILRMTQEEIARGISFGMALKRRPDYFPRLTTSMIVVGERSGNLENMLDNLSQFYEDQVDDTLKTLVTVLEPALLLGVGLMVGTLALSIIVPIYQLIQTVR